MNGKFLTPSAVALDSFILQNKEKSKKKKNSHVLRFDALPCPGLRLKFKHHL